MKCFVKFWLHSSSITESFNTVLDMPEDYDINRDQSNTFSTLKQALHAHMLSVGGVLREVAKKSYDVTILECTSAPERTGELTNSFSIQEESTCDLDTRIQSILNTAGTSVSVEVVKGLLPDLATELDDEALCKAVYEAVSVAPKPKRMSLPVRVSMMLYQMRAGVESIYIMPLLPSNAADMDDKELKTVVTDAVNQYRSNQK